MFSQVEQQVLAQIIPTQKDRERLNQVVSDLVAQLTEMIRSRGLQASVLLVGSIAKDTFLSHSLDVDLFICYPQETVRQVMAEETLQMGRKLLRDTEECYAEHPYIRGTYAGYLVEVVPCYQIDNVNQKVSAVDRTPLHTEYVITHLAEEQKDHVRLFKQFLKGIGCYGAEAEVEGFSGYLCELLILYYGTFHKLTDRAQKWGDQMVLTLTEDSDLRFDTSLVFIDPVDADRNVASALSAEKYALFKQACAEYSDKGWQTFFFPNPITPWSLERIKQELKKFDETIVGVQLPCPDIIAENLYPQVRKALRSVHEVCERYEFPVSRTDYFVDGEHALIYLIVQTPEPVLSSTRLHMGPPVKQEKNSERFKRKWKSDPQLVRGPYIEQGRLYVEIQRRYRQIMDLLEDTISELSLGKHIDKIAAEKYQVCKLDELLVESLRVFWTVYLDGKYPWER